MPKTLGVVASNIRATIEAIRKKDAFALIQVITPTPILGAALRRDLAEEKECNQLLFGVKFTLLRELALELFTTQGGGGGGVCELEDLNGLVFALRKVFGSHSVKRYAYYDPQELELDHGHAEAFAETILELENSLVTPHELLRKSKGIAFDEKKIKDLCAIWKASFQYRKMESLAKLLVLMGKKANGYFISVETGYESNSEQNFFSEIKANRILIPRLQDVAGVVAELQEWASFEEELASSVHWIANQVTRNESGRIGVIVPGDYVREVVLYFERYLKSARFYSREGRSLGDSASGTRLSALCLALDCNLFYTSMIHLLPHLKGTEAWNHEKWASYILEKGIVEGEDWVKFAPPEFATGLKELYELTKLGDAGALVAGILEFYSKQVQLPPNENSVRELARNFLVRFCARTDLALVPVEKIPLLVQEEVLALRERTCKLSENRIFVGTLEESFGLEFDALRLMGLSEKVYPHPVREDPVLPEDTREYLGVGSRSQWRLHLQKDALFSLLTHRPRQLCFSYSIQSIDALEHAPSSLFVELAMNVKGKELDELFLQSRQQQKKFPLFPLTVGAWVKSKVKTNAKSIVKMEVPASWCQYSYANLQTAISNLELLLHPQKVANSYEGVFLCPSPDPKFLSIHPSRIGTLLECPRAYLFAELLKWSAGEEVPAYNEVSSLDRGGLIHLVCAKAYSVKDGGEKAPAAWNAKGKAQRQRELEQLARKILDASPMFKFLGRKDRVQMEKDLIKRLLGRLIESDVLESVHRPFDVACEQKFGPVTLTVATTTGRVELAGTIDRIDQYQGKKGSPRSLRLLDFKSGRQRDKDRNSSPWLPSFDVQLYLYYKLLEQTPSYRTLVPRTEAIEFRLLESSMAPKRAFAGSEVAELLVRGDEWLDLIITVLNDSLFPMSPLAIDDGNGPCKYCDYKVICTAGIRSERFGLPLKSYNNVAKLNKIIRGISK
ncbi:MAG: PD-(D/E)XK nuclease family protein [Oligoflexia bacterium]|nr:PD-(D/E)XK nuclease family protein [Oligoflexia bacterium]